MVNVDINTTNNRVICLNGLCNREVGLLRSDNVHVLLFSYRKGRQVHSSTLTENDGDGSHNLIINHLIDMNDLSEYTIDINTRQLNETVEDETNMEMDREVDNDAVVDLPNSESSGPSSSFLDQLVEDIIGVDFEQGSFFEQLCLTDISFYGQDNQV